MTSNAFLNVNNKNKIFSYNINASVKKIHLLLYKSNKNTYNINGRDENVKKC